MNCSSRASSSWVKLDTTVQNHFITCGNRRKKQHDQDVPSDAALIEENNDGEFP